MVRIKMWLRKAMNPNTAFSVLAYAATLFFILLFTLFAPLVVRDSGDAPKSPTYSPPRGR